MIQRRIILFIALCFIAWSAVFIYRTSFIAIDGQRYFYLFDDAMISMRYAWNLSHGNGLVWNAGEQVMGYTNLLMTLIMSLATLLFDKSPAVLAIHILGIGLMLAIAFVTMKIADSMLPAGEMAWHRSLVRILSFDETREYRTELFIDHYHLRTVGYVCFRLMVALIIAGFASGKTGLSSLGAGLLFLPVFAQFATVMFFLAGLGFLNLAWLPVLDTSFDIGRLGDIVYLPYDLLLSLFRGWGVDIRRPLVVSIIGGGLLLFAFGTLAWFVARQRHKSVADLWIYRLTRHPQYLGWIVWSYGMLLALKFVNYPSRAPMAQVPRSHFGGLLRRPASGIFPARHVPDWMKGGDPMSSRLLKFAAALALVLASGAALACPGKTTATEGSQQQGSGSPTTADTRG